MLKLILAALRIILHVAILIAVFSSRLAAQEEKDWRISPEKINVQLGADRQLQILDDSAQELHDAVWAVNNTDLAEIEVLDGRVVIHTKAVGTVQVSATLGHETRFRDIKIWPATGSLPPGTSNWAINPVGREIADLAAVPTENGPNVLSLEETPSGNVYLRGDNEDGIQVWTWLMPEKTSDVELVCGDWFGGALISANHAGSYTLYAVGNDGNLRWQLAAPGHRKNLAISTDHLVYLLSESADSLTSHLQILEEFAGKIKVDLPLPASHEVLVNVVSQGRKLMCSPGEVSQPAQIRTSRVYVNMDGYAYVAFAQNDWTLKAADCSAGSSLDLNQVRLSRKENVTLWQIHPDGTYRATPVESVYSEQSAADPLNVASPTGALVTDNENGLLVPIRISHDIHSQGPSYSADEYVYRLDPSGDFIYKLSLPKYQGPLRDEMLIGDHETAFATRGGLLIAFDLRNAKELWRWDSNTPVISAFAALANGDCLVQTPTALVEVSNSAESRVFANGKFMLDWRGHMYRKHN
jgi:outer membrane protein assembly factor BamB